MDKYNVTLYAAVNRYKLREAQNLFFNDYSDVQQIIDRLPSMKDICTMEVFEHRIDEHPLFADRRNNRADHYNRCY